MTTASIGYVAIVLHAHLPWVRHPEHARSLEERWLYEALWESYLPLLDVLDRLAEEGVAAPLTLSISPPLAAMLADALLRRRATEHLERLAALAAREARRLATDAELGPVASWYEAKVERCRARWEALGADLLAAFAAHAAAGRIELATSAASHAYLPALAGPPEVRAQLRLGLRAFEKLSGRRPDGLWLPECAYEPRLAPELAGAGVRYTVLDGHALELASPRPPQGVFAPVIGSSGVAFFGRDAAASHDVWSREAGYPGDPVYREFYRDIGFDLPEHELADEVGPDGTRIMTGLKYHRITGRAEKAPYDPAAARARAAEHAADFTTAREAALRGAPPVATSAPPLVVAPYDAELFGHWWLEGPVFLEAVLRRLAVSARAGGLKATTLGGYLARHPEGTVAEPAASSWGEGGYGAVWAGTSNASLWRHVHHAGREVQAACADRRGAEGVAGRALDQAIRELLLLQASDWAFMLHRREMAEYAEARARTHVHRARRLAAIARGRDPTPADASWVSEVCAADRFLADLAGEEIRDAFDPWQ